MILRPVAVREVLNGLAGRRVVLHQGPLAHCPVVGVGLLALAAGRQPVDLECALGVATGPRRARIEERLKVVVAAFQVLVKTGVCERTDD